MFLSGNWGHLVVEFTKLPEQFVNQLYKFLQGLRQEKPNSSRLNLTMHISLIVSKGLFQYQKNINYICYKINKEVISKGKDR